MKADTTNGKRLIGIGEVAELVGLAKATVYVYSSVGRLPDPDLIVNGGATKLWYVDTIKQWDSTRRKA